MRDAGRKLQKQAEQKEKEAARLGKSFSDPLYLFAQASTLRSTLVLEHGSSILAHVEALLQAGVLDISNGVLSMKGKKAPAKKAESTPKAESASAKKGNNDERNAEIIRLFVEGKKATQIVEAMGLQGHDGVVAGVIHRYNTQLAKSLAA